MFDRYYSNDSMGLNHSLRNSTSILSSFVGYVYLPGPGIFTTVADNQPRSSSPCTGWAGCLIEGSRRALGSWTSSNSVIDFTACGQVLLLRCCLLGVAFLRCCGPMCSAKSCAYIM
jgi:hypothetical protein